MIIMSALTDAMALLDITAGTTDYSKLVVIDNVVQARLRNICNLVELPVEMDNMILDCIIINYRKMKEQAEAYKTQKQGDWSAEYIEIPETVNKQISRFRKMRMG